MITFHKISNIFSGVLNSNSNSGNQTEELDRLVLFCIGINLKLWRLEDIARMKNLGFESIAKAKMEIDKKNQIRNDNIHKIDLEFEQIIPDNLFKSQQVFYSESPGMLIDRMAILFIKQNMIKKIVLQIREEYLKEEYLEKEKEVSQQIKDTGAFLDLYFQKIQTGEIFFKVCSPLKIYNDKRIRNYIRNLTQNQE